jgi:hypothetical protein
MLTNYGRAISGAKKHGYGKPDNSGFQTRKSWIGERHGEAGKQSIR